MTTPQTVIATWLLGVAAQFERLGIDLRTRQLCTVRLSRRL